MTASAAEARRVRPSRASTPLPWRRRLAWGGAASHLAVAVVVLMLSAPLGEQVPLTQLLGLAAVVAATGAGIGLVAVRRAAAPTVELTRTIEALAERGLEHGILALQDSARRPDEVGRLAAALGRLVARLSDQAAANDDFAADVAHEIRTPLASLRAAAEALRAANDEQAGRLLSIIEQDVARLDRLVGEISSASRLDAELVREEAAEFDLVVTVARLTDHLSCAAASKGIDVIPDLPADPVAVVGLEARLAQVVVNVVENAISLCEEGDAIRVWMRRRDREVLLVVEDTGPGIPEGAAEKIFRRFYSHRPVEMSGENSGLGLAISRQIVEAHGGTVWAENIRPTESDLLSEPLGARFAVVLPF